MSTNEILPVVTAVLKDFRVIATAVVVFVIMDLCCYIVKYKKKTKVKKSKKIFVQPTSASQANNDASNEDYGAGEEA